MARSHRTSGSWFDKEQATQWRRVQSWTSLLLGALLLACSAAGPYAAAPPAGEIARLVGVLLVMIGGLIAVARPLNDELHVIGAVADLVLGVFLLASPWEFGYAGIFAPTVTAVAIGALLIVLCIFFDQPAD